MGILALPEEPDTDDRFNEDIVPELEDDDDDEVVVVVVDLFDDRGGPAIGVKSALLPAKPTAERPLDERELFFFDIADGADKSALLCELAGC